MATTATATGFTTIPRTVLSMAAGVVFTVARAVQGEKAVRTARGNAWDAVCADRDRARHRAEMRRLVADLAAASAVAAARGTLEPRITGNAQLSVGSSPRSSASHARLVGSAPR